MKFARLWQPRTLLFWQWVGFNVLSSVCTWALRTLPLNTAGMLVVGAVALLNAGLGMLAMWRLLQGPAGRPPQATGASSASTASTSAAERAMLMM